ncbi:MAG: hypothetical protein AAGA15_16140, partial [Pseudomonadota bacterium]
MKQGDPPVVEGLPEARRAHLAAMLNRYVAEVETIIGRLSQGELAEASQLPKVKREMMSVSKA